MAALRSLNLDVVFLGVHGMSAATGFTTPNLTERETDRALVEAGQRLVVLADHTKWGIVGISTIAELATGHAGSLVSAGSPSIGFWVIAVVATVPEVPGE